MLVVLLFSLLNNSYFCGLNTIKVHCCGYLVCATLRTISDQFETTGSFVMVCRCACGLGIIVNLILVIFLF